METIQLEQLLAFRSLRMELWEEKDFDAAKTLDSLKVLKLQI